MLDAHIWKSQGQNYRLGHSGQGKKGSLNNILNFSKVKVETGQIRDLAQSSLYSMRESGRKNNNHQ